MNKPGGLATENHCGNTTVAENTPTSTATMLGVPQLEDPPNAPPAPRYPSARIAQRPPPKPTAGERVAEGSAPDASAPSPGAQATSIGAALADYASDAARPVKGPVQPPPGPISSRPASSGAQPTTNWPALYEELGSHTNRKALRERQRQADLEALAEYERWSKRMVGTVMEDLARAARTRATELFNATGKTLDVEYPSGPPVVGASGDAEIRFLRLSLGKACVHVYSSHARGSSTHIHLLPAFTDSLKKNHRLVSEPGAFVVRRPDDQYELRYFRGDPYGAATDTMTVDTLLYKALRLLARCTDEE